jgi:hypothetical protein
MSKDCLGISSTDYQFFNSSRRKYSYNRDISATTIAFTERICLYHAMGLRLQGC